jgi:MinD-like ATPase involved in chromosome partitioning or flagellar assembly
VEVETTLNRKLTWMLPEDWKTASTALNVGSPLADFAPKSKLRLAFQQMAADLALPDPSRDHQGAADEEPKEPNEPHRKKRFSIFSS